MCDLEAAHQSVQMLNSSRRPIKPLTGRSRDFLEIVLPAASAGNLPALQIYLKKEPRFLRAVGPHGRTLLWEAARKGRLGTVRFLVNKGVGLEVRGGYFRETKVEVTPWCIATIFEKSLVSDFLKESGATYSLDSACYLGDLKTVQNIISEYPSLVDRPVKCASGETGFRPIHYAVSGGHLQIVRELISRGADVTEDGGRLVSWALDIEETSILEILLAMGAKPRPGDANEACLDPKWASIFAPYEYELNIDAPDRHGFPPLVEACRGNHNAKDDLEEVTKLLAMGADVNVRDHKGKTPLHRAAQAGFLETFSLLMSAGAQLNATDAKGETPLFDAVRAGRVEMVKQILASGADIDHANYLGQSVSFLVRRSKKPGAEALLTALISI